jgi:hypothetical protein
MHGQPHFRYVFSFRDFHTQRNSGLNKRSVSNAEYYTCLAVNLMIDAAHLELVLVG